MQHPPRIQARDDTRNSPAVGLLRISPAMLSLCLYPRLERLDWGGYFCHFPPYSYCRHRSSTRRHYQRRVCMKEIASLDSLSIFGCKDSANRMKNQMFLDFSEVQPIFNVVKDTTFLNSSTFSRKKYNSAFIHQPSSIIHHPSAFSLQPSSLRSTGDWVLVS